MGINGERNRQSGDALVEIAKREREQSGIAPLLPPTATCSRRRQTSISDWLKPKSARVFLHALYTASAFLSVGHRSQVGSSNIT